MSESGWGGKRPGAGRPVEGSTLLRQKMRERFVELCHARGEEIFDALITAALGKYEVENRGGNAKRIYTKPPDVSALREICDRLWGRPTATVDLTTGADLETGNEILNNPTVKQLIREFEDRLRNTLFE